MSQTNDRPSRVSRAEDNIFDLRLVASALLAATDKNTSDLADLIEVTRRNSEQITVLRETMISFQFQTDEAIRDIRSAITDIRSAIAGIQASNERMDRLFDYLIHRDQGRSEEN